MKKILGISLCALFAVSAANAEIASTEWVNQKVSGLAVGALGDRVTANEQDIATNETKIGDLDTAIRGMNQTQTQGDYVTYVKQENGDVTAEGASFETSVSDTSESTIAPTSKAVAAYVKGKVDGLGVTALTGRVTTNENDITALTGRVDTTEGTIATHTTAIAENADKIATNAGDIAANEAAITALQTSTTGLADLAYKDTVATADIDANAVTSAQIADNAVTTAKIANETITDADISGTAAIATSKIAFEPTQTAALNSGITSNLVADINNNRDNLNAMLSEAGGYDTCKNSTYGCTLVVKGGAFLWEKVTRAEQ